MIRPVIRSLSAASVCLLLLLPQAGAPLNAQEGDEHLVGREEVSEEDENTSDENPDAGDDDEIDWERLRPKVRLGRVAKIQLEPRKAVPNERVAEIKKCISQLAEIDSPDFGLSATMSGSAFLPIRGQERSQAMILTDHRHKSSPALQRLVEIGPDALPYLLESLSDETPTKFELKKQGVSGGMWLDNELWGNPANEMESRILKPTQAKSDEEREKDFIESYTVKVGDVCLVAIGQIVGRGYQTVRYQPTACVVINSPTENEVLREQVRALWASEDPARKLLDSLLLDYGTEGVFQGPSLDSWDLGSELQIEAVMRLLYYFPRETAPLIAERLRTIDVGRTADNGAGSPASDEEMDAFVKREVANGMRTPEFLGAVSWCREPMVQESLRAIFVKTDDIDILLATMRSIEDEERQLIKDRLQTFLDAVPTDEMAPYGDGYNLLLAMGERLGKDAVPVFRRYLLTESSMRRFSVAEVLKRFKEDWSIEILVEFLDDKRPAGDYSHKVRRKGEEVRLRVRTCDAAAESLTRHFPELRFTGDAEYEELDEQIKVIREELAKRVK